MAYAPRVRSMLAGTGVLLVISGVLLATSVGEPAAAQPPDGEDTAATASACTVTGYAVPAGEDVDEARRRLTAQDTRRLTGVDLTRSDWVVSEGDQPMLVVDASEPLADVTVTMSVAGREVALSMLDGDGNRYVSSDVLPYLGSVTRTVGLVVTAGPCTATPVVSMDRSVWSTWLGRLSAGSTAVFGALVVVVARGRRGGWWRRFLLASPWGLLAGAALAVVLHEAGVVDPFGTPPWWISVLGLALAASLPLTRPRWGTSTGVSASTPAEVVAGYQLEAPAARTHVATLFRASRVPSVPSQPTLGYPTGAPLRALVKVALPERAGEPLTRMRLEREAALLADLDHPNVIRLRETVHGLGPPVLIFDEIDGVSLRELMSSGGGLSGPQAVTVVREVLAGLAELHRRGFVHRDVRPETIFLDRGGRVRLTSFELACVGMEHPAAVEGTPPYASPEQLAGQVIDGRSDLWACGVVLAELLTGQVPVPAQRPPLPAPLGEVVARALSPDPRGRPQSAAQFDAELRDAAARQWGPDWAGRAALTAAVTAHGAIGAMAAGYATAGPLTAAGAGTAGFGGLGGGGAIGSAGAGFGGALPAASQAVTGGQAALVAKLNALVSGAGAAVVVFGTGLAVAVVDPDPVQALTEVINPEQAQIIFADTTAEALAGIETHVTGVAWDQFEGMVEDDDAFGDARLDQAVVGVPRGQYRYPAWFVGSGRLVHDDGAISIFVRFERQAASEPWLMTAFNWAEEGVLPAPSLDYDGWLAPVPQLAVDPQTLPERYVQWLRRVEVSGEVGDDGLLTLRYDFGTLYEFAEDHIFDGDLDRVSLEHEMRVGEVMTDPVPLADGTVHISFTAILHQVMYNTPHRRSGDCGETYLFWSNQKPPGKFRQMEHDFVITVEAWIPAAGTGSGETTVTIEDWKRRSENRENTPC